MLPDPRPPIGGRAIAQPGAWWMLRRQARSDAWAVARAVVAAGGEIALIEAVRISALNSLGLCVAVGLGAVALIRVFRTVKVFRLVRRMPWRALQSAWTYLERRSSNR